MEQHLENSLRKYHDLFDSKGCKDWLLEELINNAIKSDTQAQHSTIWKEEGHDADADIRVRTNGTVHPLQIKSGSFSRNKKGLKLSGYRLGSFNGDMNEITAYLNGKNVDVIAVPHEKREDDAGRHHEYALCYIPGEMLASLNENNWLLHTTKTGKKVYKQISQHGVEFRISESMSWQVWWTIPLAQVQVSREMKIT